jgi:hypothetical protein
MKDAITALSKHDDQVPALLLELTSPALPADGLSPTLLLLALQPVRRRPGEHQQGEQDVDTHCPGGFLGGMLQALLLFTLFDTAVLDQTTVVIVIERLQRFCNRGIRQEDGFAPRSIVPIIPRADHHKGTLPYSDYLVAFFPYGAISSSVVAKLKFSGYSTGRFQCE